MTKKVVTISADDSLSTVEDIMTLGGVRHMPVVRGGALVGVVSQRDLLRASLSNLTAFGSEQRRAFLQVVENPFFAWATPDGGIIIENVPPGSYRLKAWHEEGEAAQPIVVTESGATGLLVPIDVSGYAKRPHLNKFGKPYKREKY